MLNPEKFEPKFEKPKEKEPEERLKNFLESAAKELEKEEIPVDKDCRIKIEAFKPTYGENEIKKDLKEIEIYQKRFEEERKRSLWKKNPEKLFEEKRMGENLEILKTAIFSKFLGSEFAVVRASLYDDIKNGIDNVIFEKKTGNLVCALDEVGEISGKIYERKKEKVLERNRIGGGKLKYGFKLEKGKLVLKKVSNIPIFYLALPERHINEGMKNFIPSFEEKSDFEKKLFTYFLSTLVSQINSLKLEQNLNPILKRSLIQFEKTIKTFRFISSD